MNFKASPFVRTGTIRQVPERREGERTTSAFIVRDRDLSRNPRAVSSGFENWSKSTPVSKYPINFSLSLSLSVGVGNYIATEFYIVLHLSYSRSRAILRIIRITNYNLMKHPNRHESR